MYTLLPSAGFNPPTYPTPACGDLSPHPFTPALLPSAFRRSPLQTLFTSVASSVAMVTSLGPETANLGPQRERKREEEEEKRLKTLKTWQQKYICWKVSPTLQL